MLQRKTIGMNPTAVVPRQRNTISNQGYSSLCREVPIMHPILNQILIYCTLLYFICRKVASTNPSLLEAHADFFRLSMKGKFDANLLWPFGEKLISIF